ncbi:MAG: hypothetical protein ACXU88_03910 [Myxococcaceae bacterium]
MTVMLKVGTRFERFSDAGTQARRGYPGATPGRLLGALVLVVGGVGLGAGQDAGVLDARRSFAPPGWEIGDCPPAYGKDSVLCAGTDTGPFKVDRHIPTMWIRAPGGSCAETEKDAVGRLAKYGMTVSRKSTGRCGPKAAPCTEIPLKDPRPTDPLAPLLYVVCPAAGPVEVVEYGVSARVIDAFEPVARVQARWQPDR